MGTFAWEYHNRTKHSPRSIRENVHFLDWDNEPLLFKIYTDLEPIPLPVEGDLGKLLYYSAGITRRRGQVMFRAYSNTGALYEIELYVVCDSGVYHYGPYDQALRRLRAGDFRGALRTVDNAKAVIVSTGTYWRNAWKYQARTYRHFGWDNGTLHANLLAMANALGLPARLLCGFVDDDVNHLLGLDTRREVSLALVALSGGPPAPPPVEVPPLDLRTVPLSKREVDYPLMREMHAASSLASPEEVLRWREARLPAVAAPEDRIESVEEVILRRGSTRRFERTPIQLAQLSTMLHQASAPIDADFLDSGASLNEMYVVAHAVEGLEPGAYYYDVPSRSLQPLRHGNFRKEAAFLALDQDLAGDAAAAVFFLADLGRVLDRLGDRGYRAVQLEAGIRGGRLYLGAYALRLGATGLTFYDDEVTDFFSPHAAGKSAIFLVAVGRPAAKRL
jgi:SagB-type dehydrogenase family enzyme